MINPISFLWKQFNGPQITAVCTAIYQYIKDTIDASLDYFNTFSIHTATDAHLTTIGIVQGLARPLLPIPASEMFIFSDVIQGDNEELPEYPSERGFNEIDTDNPIIDTDEAASYMWTGGKLAPEVEPKGMVYLSTNLYRACLGAIANSTGQLGSIVALDDMLNALWSIGNASEVPSYRIMFAAEDAGAYMRGDIEVDLGSESDWYAPYEVQAEISLLGKTIYYPMPKVVVRMIEGD